MTQKKLPTEKYFQASVTFRGNQKEKIRFLQTERRLSAICQAAVDQQV